MKCQPKGESIIGKRKNCVYCGKGFDVRTNLVKELSE